MVAVLPPRRNGVEDLIVAPGEADGPLADLHSSRQRDGLDALARRSFDATYGLNSPFSVLRLYPLAGQRDRESATGEGATGEGTHCPMSPNR